MAFECTLDEYKQQVAKLAKHIDNGVRGEPLRAAFKCMMLHYFNMAGDAGDKAIAVTYLKWVMPKYVAVMD